MRFYLDHMKEAAERIQKEPKTKVGAPFSPAHCFTGSPPAGHALLLCQHAFHNITVSCIIIRY